MLSVGQGPTSAVHAVFSGSGLSAAEAARSRLLASLCDGGGDTAGSCLVGAVAPGSAARGGSFSPGAACTGSVGAAFEIGGDASSLRGTPGRPPRPIHKATPAQPSNARTRA